MLSASTQVFAAKIVLFAANQVFAAELCCPRQIRSSLPNCVVCCESSFGCRNCVVRGESSVRCWIVYFAANQVFAPELCCLYGIRFWLSNLCCPQQISFSLPNCVVRSKSDVRYRIVYFAANQVLLPKLCCLQRICVRCRSYVVYSRSVIRCRNWVACSELALPKACWQQWSSICCWNYGACSETIFVAELCGRQRTSVRC